MSKKALVIVESPSKAKTIQKYLGRDYIVKASVGHVKDLPKSKLGVDTEKSFEPDYQVIASKVKIIEELKKASESVPELYLATDPDREGEAIAWHIRDELKVKTKKVYRVLINSITKTAVLEALAHPQELNADKYNAQQARRILDRLVGYKISPLLWDKVKRGISAGRVQSVALRLIVDREREIKAFKPEEYWEVEGTFEKEGTKNQSFLAKLFKTDGKNPELASQQSAETLLSDLSDASWSVGSLEQKERLRRPTPPFITSRLQQEAARKLGFSAKKTMMLAQRLYEGLDLGELGTHGLITYMRTDSVRIEPGALQAVRQYIEAHYGKDFIPPEPNYYKSNKSAQEAHEAIRPTSMEFIPNLIGKYLEKDELNLYCLVWNRFVASQMMPALYDQTTLDLIAKDKKNQLQQFRATGSIMKFPGFTQVYLEGHEDGESSGEEKALKIPNLQKGDSIQNTHLDPSQHFTQPPPRYSDASLIKELEEKGIGRPSTYATILSNLQEREYIEKRENRFYPSELGVVVTDLLIASFPDILNSEFTASMENQLDAIEEGKENWKKTLEKFWKPFESTLESAKKHMKDVKRQEVPTSLLCDKCQQHFVIKWGKLGSFLACSNYPDCKNTQDFQKDSGGNIVITPKQFTSKNCEKCQKPMVIKAGKFGKFLACSDYPNCKSTLPFTLGIQCPQCKEGEIAEKLSRFKRVFYSCDQWPNCSFSLWNKPVQRPCPQCQFPLLTEKVTKRLGSIIECSQKECDYKEIARPV